MVVLGHLGHLGNMAWGAVGQLKDWKYPKVLAEHAGLAKEIRFPWLAGRNAALKRLAVLLVLLSRFAKYKKVSRHA